MSSRKKGKSLSLSKKYVIVQRLKSGESPTKLSMIYNVPRTTINDMKRDAEKIERYVNNVELENGNVSRRKTMTKAAYDQLDAAMYHWYIQQCAKGWALTGAEIKQKALDINKKMKGNSLFKASDGWLDKFKNRHGIKLTSSRGKFNKETLQKMEAVSVKKKIRAAIERLNLTADQIYNCDETGVYWNQVPKEVTEDFPKKRITIFACANASGRHRLPLVAIDKDSIGEEWRYPTSGDMPVDYRVQKHAWINKEIFSEWFETTFAPSVKSFLKERGLKKKALLILDNSPLHPNWTKYDRNCNIIYLPFKVTSIVQPMNLGIVDDFKFAYRKRLVENMKMTSVNINEFIAGYSLKDALKDMSLAWKALPESTFRTSWKNLLRKETITSRRRPINVAEMQAECAKIPELKNVGENEVHDWLCVDREDYGYEVLTDTEIIDIVTKKSESQTTSNGKQVEMEQAVKQETGEEQEASPAEHVTVENMLSKCIEWLQNQDDTDSRQVDQLKDILSFVKTKNRIKTEPQPPIRIKMEEEVFL